MHVNKDISAREFWLIYWKINHMGEEIRTFCAISGLFDIGTYSESIISIGNGIVTR